MKNRRTTRGNQSPNGASRPTQTPAVLAFDEGPLFRVQCPYCGKPHFHGRGGGAGLRISHCGDGKLYSLVVPSPIVRGGAL